MQIRADYQRTGALPMEKVILLIPIIIDSGNIDQAERLGELN